MFKRPNNSSLPDDQIQDALQTVANTFGLPWLVAQGGNALQRLWARGDQTSTLELLVLATSLTTLQGLNATWLKDQVKSAKSPNDGVAKGALFEIFALNMLHGPTQHVAPARANQAGYDGLLTSSDGKQLRVSIKHYGGSRRLREFEDNALAVEQQILTLFKESGYPPCQIVLDFSDKYPDKREWELLRDGVSDWFQQHKFDDSPVFGYAEQIDSMQPLGPGNARSLFMLMFGRFKGTDLQNFHPGFTSYSFIASSIYHPNEIQNFYSKLDEGCANLSKHATVETPHIANVLFVHLPETVTLAQAEQWVQAYFTERPHKPVSGVLLYQPLVVQNQKQESVLTNGFKICIKPGGMMATHFKTSYTITPPIGHFSTESPMPILIGDAGAGEERVVPLTDRYVYQQGHHYHRMRATHGTLIGNMSSHAGVHTHTVIDTHQMGIVMGIPPSSGPQLFTLQARHPQVDTLLIM